MGRLNGSRVGSGGGWRSLVALGGRGRRGTKKKYERREEEKEKAKKATSYIYIPLQLKIITSAHDSKISVGPKQKDDIEITIYVYG